MMMTVKNEIISVELLSKLSNDELSVLIGTAQAVLSQRQKEFPDTINRSDVSTRCKNALGYHGIKIWADIVRFTKSELRKMRNVGDLTIVEIEDQLALRGMQFRIPEYMVTINDQKKNNQNKAA